MAAVVTSLAVPDVAPASESESDGASSNGIPPPRTTNSQSESDGELVDPCGEQDAKTPPSVRFNSSGTDAFFVKNKSFLSVSRKDSTKMQATSSTMRKGVGVFKRTSGMAFGRAHSGAAFGSVTSKATTARANSRPAGQGTTATSVTENASARKRRGRAVSFRASTLQEYAHRLVERVESAVSDTRVDELRDISKQLELVSKSYVSLVKAYPWALVAQVEDQVKEVEPESEDDDIPEPKRVEVKRRGAVSTEAFGAWNMQRAKGSQEHFEKAQEDHKALMEAMRACTLLKHMNEEELTVLADAMPLYHLNDGDIIVKQGQAGTAGFVILRGDADVFNQDCVADGDPRGTFVRTMGPGRLFGENALWWSFPYSRAIYARGPLILAKLEKTVYADIAQRRIMAYRQRCDEILRKVSLLETITDEQIAQLTDIVDHRKYEPGEVIIRQGDVGNEFFVVFSGECVASMATGAEGNLDIQEVRHYTWGTFFGEKAVLGNQGSTRAATIAACKPKGCEVLAICRYKFQRLLGSFDQFEEISYLTDPRKSISDFFARKGAASRVVCDEDGEDGTDSDDSSFNEEQRGSQSSMNCPEWFAVYRPTSRDAIAKMLNCIAVGKGLNVKGKSAKKNYLSGFVPFMQISDNDHKQHIQASPPEGRVQIYFTMTQSRDVALGSLTPLLDPSYGLDIEDRNIHTIETYTSVFGIDVPEPVVREAFIMRPDISFLIGWETGRQSEPAFMDFNLDAVAGRSDSEPKVVLYQIDNANPMNSHGLLIAYAEAYVKPVVSDFDTFTIGSKGVTYYPPLHPVQASVAKWAMERTREIFRDPGPQSWTSRWLKVLRQASEEGFHPEQPKYGFGDPTSYKIVQAVVQATGDSGAVRHGSECFNFKMVQELDDDYLIVWEGFTPTEGRPWKYMTPQTLREFLLSRIREGFIFPLNPVWIVRDEGWADIFFAMISTDVGKKAYETWFPKTSGLIEIIREIRAEFPNGFCRTQEPTNDTNEASGPLDGGLGQDMEASELAGWVDKFSEKSNRGKSKWATAQTMLKTRNVVAALTRAAPKRIETQAGQTVDTIDKTEAAQKFDIIDKTEGTASDAGSSLRA
eukprot:TRINITY_DN2166_c0_g1_i6.p1 TRINITY_DN2166_c0_g1~~TRINITY_DN2166_c0_g1_i6.p1  ORF type:complete len:1095 (-),score=187.03 TRINITY_DN2166_c0_g1_i6:123-3407(-)